MSAQRAPATWTLSGQDGDSINPKFGIRGDDGKWVATIAMHGYTPMLENAAFIVRACNGWDNIDALRDRIAELEGAK